MTHAVFLRAVNVGGHGTVSVAAIAKKLGLVNIGAAGTFVAPGAGSAAKLRDAVARELPFETEVMVVAAKDVLDLVAADPFAGVEGKAHVTVLARAPAAGAKLPREEKGVRHLGVRGRFALSVVLPGAKPGTTPTGVEKALGVAGTARGWPTMLKVARAIEGA